MLVVIVIIWILATALIPKIRNAESKTRDSRRKTDLNTINQAISLYHGDNWWRYPASTNKYYLSSEWAPSTSFISPNGNPIWIPGLTSRYISQIPKDPINKIGSGGLFHSYWYYGDSAFPYTTQHIYRLWTYLENTTDRATCLYSKYYIPYRVGNTMNKWYMCNTDPKQYVVSTHVLADSAQ